MAIAKIQSTPTAYSNSAGPLVLTFAVTPSSGSVIVVPVMLYHNGGNVNASAADNQGNTYLVGARSNESNGTRAIVFYAYNVTAAGTFTVTITWTGGASGGFLREMQATAIEFFGFGTVDPIVGAATATGNSTTPSVSTGITGAPEVAVIGVDAHLRANNNITSITVASVSPAWDEEFERLSSVGFSLAGEADSRVVTGSGAQTISWSVITGASWSTAIIALYGAPPVADILDYQISRHVLEEELSTSINLFQIARQVLYPYTCSPGPAPPPPGVEGCPEELADTPTDSTSGCIPEI